MTAAKRNVETILKTDLFQALAESFEEKDGVITQKNGESVYNSHLPDGITPEHVQSIHDYNGLYAEAATLAVGQSVVNLFKKDAAIKEVAVPLYMGAAKAEISVQRDRTVNIPNQNGGTTQSVQPVAVVLRVTAPRVNKQVMADIKTELIRQMAADK